MSFKYFLALLILTGTANLLHAQEIKNSYQDSLIPSKCGCGCEDDEKKTKEK